MQTLDKFNDSLGTAIALTGGPGSGKTSLAGRLYPKTAFVIADMNFTSGKRYWEEKKLTNVIGFVSPMIEDNGTRVPPSQCYGRLLLQTTELTKDPAVDCIAFDSGTLIEDIFKAKIVGAQSWEAVRMKGFEHWGDLQLVWKSFIMQLRTCGKKIIFLFHEEKEKDESDQMFKYKLALDGRIVGKLPALFSDVWRCEVQTEGVGNAVKHIWRVRCLPDPRQEHLKNTFGLPGVITQDELVLKYFTAK